MLDAGMTLALATDICPGGWTESMQLVMQFACRQHRLSPEEALYAATVGGARALALPDRGALAPGLRADIQIWDVSTFAKSKRFKPSPQAKATYLPSGESEG